MLDAAFEAGQRAWPGVNLERDAFAAHMATAAPELEALEQRGADLYLAAACVANLPAAIAHFERAFLTTVTRQLGRVALSPHEEDELRQRLRVKLLVGPSAKILEYRGSGPLGAWVRVCALRMALDLAAAPEQRRQSDERALDALAATGPEGEVLLDSHEHREPFRAALQEALALLSARDKTLVRLHFLDGMSIDALGVMFKVHRATVARWLVAIRGGVLAHVRQRLALELGASSSEAHSLVRLLGPDVQLSIRRLLGQDPNG